MFSRLQKLASNEGNVWKYIFETDNAIAESVLYKYTSFENRTVICCSTQSGCPVGCSFCGTGKRFIRNLTYEEIIQQVDAVLTDMNINTETCRKLQIMFMSMGEPMLNWNNVATAIKELSCKYPNAQLLISTVGIKDCEVMQDIIRLSASIDTIGLQFSIHEAFDDKRNNLIPYANKLNLREIRDFGIRWHKNTGKHPYLNYFLTPSNSDDCSVNRLKDLFTPDVFNFTFSVLCSTDHVCSNTFHDIEYIQSKMALFVEDGYNCRLFNPAGQDDIGGGCGQLWYVQEWLKNHKKGVTNIVSEFGVEKEKGKTK